jgi:spore germination protein GerM
MSAEDRLKDMMRAARTEVRASETEWRNFVTRAHRPLYARQAAAILGSVALITVAAFAAVALTRDGDERTPAPPVASTTPPSATPSVSEAPEPPDTFVIARSAAEQWFVGPPEGKLSLAGVVLSGELPRSLAPDGDDASEIAALWLRTLVSGRPSPVAETGGSTAIPDGTKLLSVTRDGNVANVDLSREFESGGGSLSMELRVGQVVYTATGIEGIDAVRILLEGERVDAIGGEGFVVSEPLARRDFQNVAPNIVVESPKRGAEVSSGFEISGFANVFEATVNIRVIDRNGKKLVDTFTTATCGTGCWGDFAETIEFEVGKRQSGLVEVLTLSAEDGSEQDVTSIPVTLVP